MYLKSIEVQGFKSFANRTVFNFGPGITGIVGPNGSGKSNVADAVRWVLGEQRIKQLRGGSMQDVIFAGTQTRKPLSYASVSLTLDNSDHQLKLDYDEVTVTRRLYRSGESEYILNGTQVRLKDVYELFYDTGIGKEGYSIIGQGQVERILNGRPEERREIFDEAAGIVRFKRRKAESLRKLQSEEANLVRVNDILAELSRQVGPLKEQAEKARTYLKKREELKAYDVNMFLYELEQTAERLKETEAQQEQTREELEQVRERAGQIRAQYEASSGRISAFDEKSSQLSAQLTELMLRSQQCEGEIRLLEEQIRNARTDKERQARRLEAIGAQTAQGQERIASCRQSIEDINAQIEALEAQEQELLTQIEKLNTSITSGQDEIEQVRSQQLTVMQQRTDIAARQQHFDTLIEQIQERQSQLDEQSRHLDDQNKEQEDRIRELRVRSGRIGGDILGLTEKSQAAGDELQIRQEELTQLNQQMEEDQKAYQREHSRLESMKNIAERYDGYGSSIRSVMSRKNEEEGLCGVVADLIRTNREYETAIETALGGSIQHIVTDNEDTARRMIEYLKKNRLGRATFLPVSAMTPTPFKMPQVLKEPGVIDLASTLVKADPAYDNVVEYLLGRTVVCEKIEDAVRISRKYHHALRITTLEGELIMPGGSISGGTYRNTSNLLGRRREIEELEQKVKRMRAALEKLRTQIDTCRSRRNELRDEIRSLSEKLQDKYLQQNTIEMQLHEAQQMLGQTTESRRQLQEERDQGDERIRGIDDSAGEVRRQMQELDDRSRTLEEQQQKLQQQFNQESQRQQQLTQELTQARTDAAGYRQKCEYLQREITRMEEDLQQLQQEKEGIETGHTGSAQEEEERRQQIREGQKRIEEISGQIQEVRTQIDAQAASREEEMARQKELFTEREELTGRETLLDRELFRLNAQSEKLEETRETRTAYMWDEYELTVTAAEKIRRDDLGSRTQWRKQMSTLKQEIRALGDVHVGSIEEYNEVSERYEFMSAQQHDIVEAAASLEKIIHDLDEAMRRQFKAQFALIAAEFDKSFKELFGGGQGSLEIVEDEDILEAGIRIIAQPPGKKLQNMMQLSGGEKALTAIALLFAIQNLKPSPFCLLDEIEAALDENNVDRYAHYLRKLTKNTQFIIITHRRGTMTAADVLYGVTMQEKGVSALVSVSLIESQLDD